MKIDLTKMQNRVDKIMPIFTNVVSELDTQIEDLLNAIDDNNQRIATAESQNKKYAEKIEEYKTLRNKVQAIIK